MNIAIFEQAPDVGGSEFLMLNLVKHWVRLGDRVTVFTNFAELKDRFRTAGASVNHLPLNLDIVGNARGFLKSSLLLPWAIIWCLKTLQGLRTKTDVILMSGVTEKLLITYLASRMKIPVVWLEYPPVELLLRRNFQIPKLLYRKIARFPGRIITISEHSRKSLLKETGIPGRKLTLIYPGTEVVLQNDWKQMKNKAKRMRREFRAENKLVIGNISRMALEKSQDVLLKAFSEVHRQRQDLVLLLAGRGPDLNRYRQLARDLGIEEEVRFLGFIEDRNTILAAMDVFVFPGSWKLEGFGIVLIEAMMMRLPIIAADSGPTPEIIQDGKTGKLVSPQNPQDLARGIVDVVENLDKYRKLGLNAYAVAKQRFRIERAAERIREELQGTSVKAFR